MALKLGELVAYLKADKSQLKQGLNEAERDVRQSGRQMERDTDATAKAMATALATRGREGGDGFWRSADGRLRDHKGRFAAAGAELGGAAAGGVASLGGALGDLAGAAGGAGGSLGTLILVATALGGVMVFLVPVVYALGGALASLPAIALGGGAAIGTLMLGFQGLSEAFQTTTRAGGGFVDRAYQIVQAERRLRDAHREVTAAQEALNRARKTAAERLQDLNRNLAGAHLDERAAIMAVEDAQRELDRARRSGNADDIARAQLAYDQAQQSLLDVRDRVEDLTEEQEEAAAKGVEGSDEVTAALDRQRRAVEGVEDAEHALAQARRGSGGGGGAAQEATKLAASALALVSVLKGLKPAWEDLRLHVQERLFAGVGKEVQLLADVWLPRLKTSLGGYADTFNGIFKTFSEQARDPEFMKNIGVGLESVRVLIGKVGSAIAGPGVKAFGQLAKAAGPFLTMLGDKLAGAVESFAKWIDDADKSGALTSFFEDAARYLGEIWDLGEDLIGVFGEFFSIFTDSDTAGSADGVFDGIRTALSDLRDWLDDPENRENVRAFIDGFMSLGAVGMDVFGWLTGTAFPAILAALNWIGDAWAWVSDKASDAKDWILAKWNDLVGWLKGLPGKVTTAASGLWDGIKNGFKAALNWIISKWNNLSFSLPSVNMFGATIGGGTLDTPNIPYLDVGGRILQTGMAVVHRDEIVVPAAKARRLEQGEADGGAARFLDLLLRGEFVIRGGDLVLVLREEIQNRGGDPKVVLGG